ncbi:MAG: DNRLRE domain-containing protein [Bacteroidetes bacterium]|nr:DNRLRE domain-containing protein [Bacteroidota bacterium]
MLLIFACFTTLAGIRPIDRIENEINSNHPFVESKLFRFAGEGKSMASNEYNLRNYSLLKIDLAEVTSLLSSRPHNISLIVPVAADSNVTILLTESNCLTPDFSVLTSSGISTAPENAMHYYGIINGNLKSVCSFSIFRNEIMGIISLLKSEIGDWKIENDPTDLHILYNDKDMINKPVSDCHTAFDDKKYEAQQLTPHHTSLLNCIRIYWEINYDIYQDKGSMNNTINYAIGLFNESATLYLNDNIPVELSQVYIWDTPSPYTSTSTIGLLNQFQAYRNSFSGDLGSLLGYVGGGGVAASINGLCSSNLDYSQCYSMVMSAYANVPTYSWSVEVVTHEQGHLMGSRHTHACVWNGNNSAIDGCGPSAGYPYEGSCSGAPIPSAGGTIMSYCHMTSAGINFSLGFGTQPATVIQNNYSAASCLTPCNGSGFCEAAYGLQHDSITTSSVYLSWDTAYGAVSYIVMYREVGTSTWIVDTVTTSSYSVSGLIPGTTYEWQVQTLCTANSASISAIDNFITVPLVCNAPTALISSNVSSVSALLTWTAATAAIGYTVQYRVVGAPTWLTANTNTNSIQLTGLSSSSTYEWEVETICAGGGTSVFSSVETFLTAEAGAPITVTLQPDSVCGKDALIANNIPSGLNYSNHGDSPEFNALAWTLSGARSDHRSLLEFDLSFIPAGSQIISAELSLFWDPTSSNPGHSTMSGSNSATLFEIDAPWDEHTVTWVNQPPSSPLHSVAFPASTSSTQDYLNIDVHDMIQDFVDHPESNYGMILQLDNENAYRSLIFASSDHPNPNLHPKLVLTYAPNVNECVSYKYSACYGIDAEVGDCVPAGYPNLNFGTYGELSAIAWTFGGAPTDIRSLMFWDLSSIPQNAIVTSATIDMFWNANSINPGHSQLTGSNECYIQKVTSPWAENSVTWNTQPSTDTTNQVYVPASTNAQQDYTFNVTDLVQDMVANPADNYGFMLRLINENYYRSLVFCSSDYPDPAKHPQINVCYKVDNGISPLSIPNDILVAQNVAEKTVTFKMNPGFDKGTVFTLFNELGQDVMHFVINGTGPVSISTESLSPGVYFYLFKLDQLQKAGKVPVIVGQ